MSKRLEHLLAGLALLLVLIGFYSDKLFGPGYIFTEVIQDITNIYGFYPWDSFSAEQLKSGYFPLWNSHNGLGVPHLANMQSAIFYPLNWLKFALGFWNVIDWILIIRLWLAGFFLYLFVRAALGLDAVSGIFAGLSFALCGYFLRYVYMSHLNVECLIPLQLYLFHLLLQKRKMIYWLLSGLGIYLLITGGFPEASLYAVLFCALYLLFGESGQISFGKKSVLLASALGFGLLLASAQWLPFYEYLGQAWTYHQGNAGLRHLDPAYAVSILLPWFFGSNSESTLIAFLVPGMGMISVILCLRAMLSGRSLFRAGFWVVALIMLLGLIYGIPPFMWLGKIFPFSLTYNYKYAIPVLSLCVSVLAGVGLRSFSRENRPAKDLLAIGVVWLWAGANLVIALLDGFQPFYGYGAEQEMARLAILSAVLLLVLTLRRKPALGRLAVILILLCLFGSVYFDGRMNRGIDLTGYVTAQTEAAKPVSKAFPAPYRYSAEGDILFPDLLLPLGVDDLRSYDPLYPRTYVYLMASLNELSREEQINRHYFEHKLFQIDREHLNSALVPILNLMLYSADYDLGSRPLASALLKGGKETGDFAGWAREQVVEISGRAQKSILIHANDKLESELPSAVPASDFYFEAGVAPAGGKFEGDGAQIQVMISGGAESRLDYSRFLNPAGRPEERTWKPVRIRLWTGAGEMTAALSGLSGPRGDHAGDYVALGGIRLNSQKYQVPGAENLTPKGDLSLNYLRQSFPRYFLVQGAGVEPSKNIDDEWKIFLKLNSAQAGYFRNQAVVAERIKFDRSGKKAGGESWVKAVGNKPERSEIELRAPQDCILVASDQYFPGWRAVVDGREERIYRADLALRAVPITVGEHRVKFLYQPWSFRIGLWLSLSGVFMLAISFLTRLLKSEPPGRP